MPKSFKHKQIQRPRWKNTRREARKQTRFELLMKKQKEKEVS